jgi:hypothetical protein
VTDPASSARGDVRVAAGVGTAALLGAGCFALIAALGQVAGFVLRLVSSGRLSEADAARIGWLYVGAFHHIPIVVHLGELDIGRLTGGVVPGSGLPVTGSISGELGVALLLATGLAAWALVRAGRRAASVGGGGSLTRTLIGAAVALGYALPIFALSWLVRLHVDLTFGTLASGHLDARLSSVPALVLPFFLATIAGGAGGFASAAAMGASDRARRTMGALAGGWRMLLLAVALSFAGLFVVGAVQPDGPAATLTPSTATYFRTVFDRPLAGLALFAHHVAVAPNEALWTLAPAMGGCDGASGSVSVSFLCYWRSPESVTLPIAGVGSTALSARAGFASAPPPYLAFLIVPAAAAYLGGRHGASRARANGRREGAAVGAASGVVFAGLVGVVAWLSTLSVTYAADFQGRGGGAGSVRAGPFSLWAAGLALAWGTVFGWLGGRTIVRASDGVLGSVSGS